MVVVDALRSLPESHGSLEGGTRVVRGWYEGGTVVQGWYEGGTRVVRWYKGGTVVLTMHAKRTNQISAQLPLHMAVKMTGSQQGSTSSA